ncbi:DUF305 domain-containing protein [Spirosoma sp. SC4-14]|uniref:DUF305 domain-containing protein n=1 Tax=Spirosoma sp. SC4-14 TaxID=3128900 RepID=UPI0030D1E115
MKALHTNIFGWLLAITLSGSSMLACAQATTGTTAATKDTIDPAKTKLLQPMQQMMQTLKKLQPTGDPDFDYSFQAKAHLQGEQELLKQEIANGKDSTLKKMAQTMLTGTQTDLSLVDATMRQLKPTRPNQAFVQQQSKNVQAMALKLQQGGTADKLTSDFDKNFVTILLDHRQNAIDMATTYLQYGKNDTLRNYAQKLVTQAKTEMTNAKAALPKQN